MSASRGLWPALLIGSAVLTATAYLAGIDSPVRTPLALWFLLVCPGMAWARLLPLGNGYTQLSVALALSIALETIVAGAFLYLGAWSSSAILAVVVALTVGGALVQIVRPPSLEPAGMERP